MVSKISNVLMTLIVAAVVFVAGALIVPRLFGFKLYGVLSGSMEPKFHVGSVVYVKSIAPEKAKVGDAITFKIEGEKSVVATHRIIKINKAEKTFTTKGDANHVADGRPVMYASLIGKAVFSVPLLGYMIMYIQTLQGMLACICIILLMVFLSLLGDVFKKETPREVEI